MKPDDLTPEQRAYLVATEEAIAHMERLSNAALADLLYDYVLPLHVLGSPQALLLAEVMARLQQEEDA